MIDYSRFELPNGLRVLLHKDNSTPLVAVNMLYNVGSRDEYPDKTGFAHLFEHLMFGGSMNIPDFDDALQLAGGENNAFTNNDITNFYIVLPLENLEVALWLESDRLFSLNFSEKVLKVQRKVVVEEFKETCLNQPYGDVWHHISELAYKVHPYQWPTIGKTPSHVEKANLNDVRSFFFKYYRPNNAVLTIAGNIDEAQVKELVTKWFGNIPAGELVVRNLPEEPRQREVQIRRQTAKVPLDAIYMAFHMCSRTHKDFYAIDLLSDSLCNGPSTRLFRRLLKEQELFSQIDCFISGTIDPGLIIIEGKPSEGVSMEAAEAAIWKEIEDVKNNLLSEKELEKLKNKAESTLIFAETSVLHKAINLAFFELLGDANLINLETEKYREVSAEDIMRVANQVFTDSNCSKLYYFAEEPNSAPVVEQMLE